MPPFPGKSELVSAAVVCHEPGSALPTFQIFADVVVGALPVTASRMRSQLPGVVVKPFTTWEESFVLTPPTTRFRDRVALPSVWIRAVTR